MKSYNTVYSNHVWKSNHIVIYNIAFTMGGNEISSNGICVEFPEGYRPSVLTPICLFKPNDMTYEVHNADILPNGNLITYSDLKENETIKMYGCFYID